MKLMVNGRDVDFSGGSIVDLISHLGLNGTRLVVERNGAVVHRQDLAETSLNDGDVLELVRFVGGG